MTISKETTTEREVWQIPTKEVEIKVFAKETEEFIRGQIEVAREKERDFPVARNLVLIKDSKAILARGRRKDDPGIIEIKWTAPETFLQALNGIMGGGGKTVEREGGIEESLEPAPSWIIRTLEGTKEIFPSWRLTEGEGTKEECQVFFIKSSQISFSEDRVTSINWSVFAWRQPKRFQFLRDLFR